VWTSPAAKARLRQVCDERSRHGVFGAPFFVVDGEPFWGNDRRAQIERWLRGGSFQATATRRPLMQLLDFLITQVHANRLANHRLHHAMRDLTREQYLATRTSFFPSLAETLQHILEVDLYYISALHGEADMARHWDQTPKHETVASLAAAQALSDQRFIDHVAGLDARSARRRGRDGARRRPDPARPARQRHRPPAQPPGASPRPGPRHARRHGRDAAAARRVPDGERGASAPGRRRRARLDRGDLFRSERG
jgi:hypothetical protein